MRIPTLSVLLLSLAVCIPAAKLPPLLAPRVRPISAASIGRGLERRQAPVQPQSTVPSQCTSSCNSVNNEVSLGCPVTACCTISFETQYYNCLECVGSALNAANYSTAQTELNLLYMTCVDMGFVLPPMALPGQPASGSGPAASPPVHVTSTASPATPTSAQTTAGQSSSSSTGAAVNSRWCGLRLEVLASTAVLLGVVGLW